ncbi:putative hydrolase [compost metagenome]
MTADVRSILDLMHRDWGLREFYLTGVSFGGNLLLKFLVESAEEPVEGLLGAAALSAAIDFNRVTFREGLSWGYERYFLAKLKRKMERKVRLSPGGAELAPYVAKFDRVKTLRDFDTLITAPLNGYDSAEHYYTEASAADALDRIAVPTLLVHAEDDPFVPFAMYRERMARIRSNPMILPVFPATGGHVGFYADAGVPRPQPWMDERWSENAAIAFLASLEADRA